MCALLVLRRSVLTQDDAAKYAGAGRVAKRKSDDTGLIRAEAPHPQCGCARRTGELNRTPLGILLTKSGHEP
jgi:hypothetical protein